MRVPETRSMAPIGRFVRYAARVMGFSGSVFECGFEIQKSMPPDFESTIARSRCQAGLTESSVG